MNVNRKMRSFFLRAFLSIRVRDMRRWLSEIRRRLLRRPHRVSAFLQLDDPYSYLLAYYLPSLAESCDIELRLYLSEARGDAYQPMPDMLAEYAITDCERLAKELGIPFLDKGNSPPVEHRLSMLDAIAACRGDENYDEELIQALHVFWRGDAEAAARRTTGVERNGMANSVIVESRALQQRLGHYNSGTLHYAGEWYWGIDRLHYLLDRLAGLGAMTEDPPNRLLASIRQVMQVSLPVAPPAAARNLPPLELFHSFRSPYSYLLLRRIFEIADAYGLELRLRPVLPMVMRGTRVPTAKLHYIVKDAAREADRLGIGFGKIADPIGSGAKRCLAAFRYAESQRCGRDFLLNVGAAVWERGIDVATDAGMRKVAGKTGLSWPELEAAMKDDSWRRTAEHNRESMMASGSWGVPTIRMGEFMVWGQDREWLLVRHIEELCDTGDGILV